MILNVDEYNSINAIIPGLFQFSENDLFSQAELAITENELLLYDDNAPDEVVGDTYHYAVKKRVPLDDIKIVLNEKIINNREMSTMGRLVFGHIQDEQSFIFYYFVNDKKLVDSFVKALGQARIKCKKLKIDLGRDNL